MPHDRDGKLLQVGDSVYIAAKVKQITMGEEYCNVTLETKEKMFPSDSPTAITLNAKQVVKLVSVEAVA